MTPADCRKRGKIIEATLGGSLKPGPLGPDSSHLYLLPQTSNAKLVPRALRLGPCRVEIVKEEE
jgi:hypothetical protein